MKGKLVHITPSFGPVLHTAIMLDAQLPQVSASANLPHRQTSELTTYQTKTYASSCTIANCCSIKTKTRASYCDETIASCCAIKTKTYACCYTVASCADAVKLKRA